MEGIIAECGDKNRIELFVDNLCQQLNFNLTPVKKWELIEDIYEQLENIMRKSYDVHLILNKYFDFTNLEPPQIRSKL